MANFTALMVESYVVYTAIIPQNKSALPYAVRVTDRICVQRLAIEALQEMCIKYRWQALDEENIHIEKCRRQKKEYLPEILSNGDTHKQLLARSH
ncbi:hypothetical protein J5U18_03330 [Sphingobacteriaceae bacterium WQ 2009]|uniref:Uncharacterized protein n=1 Tax=Rhinopithecimicrobium faecis TaxID=2820698 RepID=A0A8T4H745_9SPHI|nr:hypothetical protein [Sphingobacteriaceae bacterium WQ 2009]